jgi:phosphate-selective porin OprO/OprP
LQLTDRSINNARFTIDRDFGFQMHHLNENSNKFSYNIKTAVSTGEGRNITGKSDDGIALTSKLEVMPFGAFTRDGTNFEGDLVREKNLKLLISVVFQQNNNAQRTQGQLGNYLFEKRTMQSVLLDGMIKYNGWAAMVSYMSRVTSENAITFNPTNSEVFNYVFVGNGFDYQLSYLFNSKYEFIARYSIQNVDKNIKLYTPNTKEYTFGITKYIWEHSFKIQTEVTYDSLEYFNQKTKNNWYLRFQIEIGI